MALIWTYRERLGCKHLKYKKEKKANPLLSFLCKKRESRFKDEGEVTKYSSTWHDNYNRDIICEVCNFNEYSFLAIYLTTVKDVSAGMTGAIIGTSALVGVFASFIGGNLSDRFGRKMIIIWSMIVWVFVFIGFSVADHVLSFFLLNALNGLCRSFLNRHQERYYQI